VSNERVPGIGGFEPPKVPIPHEWLTPRHRLYRAMISNYIETWPEQFYDELIVDCSKYFPKTIFVSDPVAIRHIFQASTDHFVPIWQQKRICRSLFGGPSIASSDGDMWLMERKAIEFSLSPSRLKRFTASILSNAYQLADDVARTTSAIPMSKAVSRFALKNVAGLALSWPTGDYLNDLADDLDEASESIGQLTATTFFRWFDMIPSGRRGRGARVLNKLEGRIRSSLAQRMVANETGDDLMGDMLRLRQSIGCEIMSDARIVANIMALLAAGYDTTASALGWFLYLIGRDDALQEEIYQEISKLGSEMSDSSSFNSAPLLKSALQECLRLYPSLPLLARRSLRADEVAGHLIKPNTTIFVSPYVVHRHRRLWDKPDIFDPDRFSASRKKEHVQGSYIPFGVGQRTCVGFQLANREILLAVATILNRARIDLPPGMNISLKSRLGLKSVGLDCLQFRAR
jgi:cytochrome P450